MWNQWNSLVDIRISELRLYWTRFSALLVVNGGALALFRYWTNPDGDCGWESVVVAGLGTLLAYLSVRILKGSHFWVRWWEDRLLELEQNMITSESNLAPIFSKHPHYLEKGKAVKHTSTFENANRVMYVVLISWSALLVYALVSASRSF